MKKTRFLVLVLALMLLIAGAVGVSVAAEGEPSLSIAKKNVSFTSSPILVFAVEAEGVAKEDIELHVFDSKEATEYYNATYLDDETIDEVTYHTYYIDAVAPKDIANEVYVQAVAGEVKSEKMRYSVLEFALEGIAKYAGVADKERVLAFYESIIDYSSGIQYMLGEKFDGINAADYNYVKVEGGTINGESVAIVADGEVTLTLTASIPSGQIQDGWNVTVAGETTKVAGNTVTITDSCTIAPVFKANGSVTTLKTGEHFNTNERRVSDTEWVVENMSGTNVNIKFYSNLAVGTLGKQNDDSLEIVTDPTGGTNGVLKFVDGSTSNYTTMQVTGSPDYVEYSSDNRSNKGVKTTFETLLYIEEYEGTSFVNSQTVAQPMFSQGGRSTALQLNITYSIDTNMFYIAPGDSNTAVTPVYSGSNYFNANEWVAIRIEWCQYDLRAEEKANIKLYINNIYAADIKVPNSMLSPYGSSGESLYGTKDVDHMMWKGISSSKAVMYFDNTSLYDAWIDQTIPAEPAE